MNPAVSVVVYNATMPAITSAGAAHLSLISRGNLVSFRRFRTGSLQAAAARGSRSRPPRPRGRLGQREEISLSARDEPADHTLGGPPASRKRQLQPGSGIAHAHRDPMEASP